LAFVLASLVAIGLKAAVAWFAAFAAAVVFAVVIPHHVDPIYELSDPTGDAAFNLIAMGILFLAVLAYFVRQRDRFQAGPTTCCTTSFRTRSSLDLRPGARRSPTTSPRCPCCSRTWST